ncbi:sulfatase [Labilibacter sediminis]|nr:sulfatase [Labilibacter sediminis]
MKHIKITFFFILALLALTVKAQEKPNILFIMSDDHSAEAVGAYGSRLAVLNPTPTIDALASEGMLMQNVFCTNSICSPSRASILTGQYSAVNGVTSLGGKVAKENQHLPNYLSEAGYQTAVIGKWHLSTQPLAFDYFKVLQSQGKYFNPDFEVIGRDKNNLVQEEGHSSDVITNEVIDWLKNRNKTKPFFVKHHFKAPHGPFDNAPRYDTYLADVEIPEPASLFEEGNHGSLATKGHNGELKPYIGSSVSGRARRSCARNYLKKSDLNGDAATKEAYQIYLKKYLRCIKGVDDNIKRVIDYLKEEGIYDNTIIIYTSDQGFYLGEHDYIDKRWGYEEGARVPFIVRYPKAIKAGLKSDAIVENVDFAPTLLDFAGIETPEVMQGKSFRTILETGKEPKDWKQAAYYHYWLHMAHHEVPAHIAIRTKTHKLIQFYGTSNKSTNSKDFNAPTPPAWELYDLQKDPHEMNNVYGQPEFISTQDKLKKELKALRAEYKEDDPKYAINKVINEYWDYTAEDEQKAIHISHEYKAERIKNPKKTRKKKK